MSRILFAFLFTVIISWGLKAQSIKGVLRDVSDNTPIPNATIKLVSATSPSSEYTSVSNNKGAFTFNEIPSGNYTLTVTSIGYETKTKIFTINDSKII